ncbi:MAG: B-box zinc finger protein [Promethearchaeota archaeon]
MLFLSVLSGIIGITTLSVLITFCVSGIFFYYISRKTNIRLLSIMGIFLIFAGICYLGICVDFLTILLTGRNTTNALLAYLIWPFVPIVYTMGFYVLCEILIPKRKLYAMLIYIFISIIFELSIFLDLSGNVAFTEPLISGDELIDDSLITGSIAGLIGTFYTLFGIFLGFAIIYKGKKAVGVIRKKYYYIALAFLIINASALLDFLGIKEIVSFVRIGSLSSVWLFYLGLRKEPEKREKKEKKEEVKIEDSLFRLTKRPDNITEEEVTYYKEQKICLVCKGHVGGFNNYICTGCDVLYCEKCARALSNLDNVCWVCDEPIDKSKPVKPILVEGIEDDREPSEKETSELVK